MVCWIYVRFSIGCTHGGILTGLWQRYNGCDGDSNSGQTTVGIECCRYAGCHRCERVADLHGIRVGFGTAGKACVNDSDGQCVPCRYRSSHCRSLHSIWRNIEGDYLCCNQARFVLLTGGTPNFQRIFGFALSLDKTLRCLRLLSLAERHTSLAPE